MEDEEEKDERGHLVLDRRYTLIGAICESRDLR
jgi:hypothetical protein